MATIRKRGDLQWEARIRRRGYPIQCKTFETRARAEAWARQIEAEMDDGAFVSRAEAERTTLAEALDRYILEILPRHKQVAQETNRIRVLQRRPIALRMLAAVRGQDVAAFIREREAEGVGANTIRLDLAVLSHLYNIACSAWGMESLGNPVDLVRTQRPKLPPGRERRLQGDEEARLLTAARTYGGAMEALITFAIATTLRRGELVAMRWEHVDRKARVLVVPETKNGTSRRVPLSSAALALLEALPRRIDGRVWGMRPDSISQAFERICRSAGIEGLTFQDLRHEATSRLFEQGLDPMEVAAITGHKTLQMLQRYMHISIRVEDLVGRLG
ncbi:MAG: tyrosine-type recombinase/integrase [Acidiferrobacteraceae bacterium]